MKNTRRNDRWSVVDEIFHESHQFYVNESLELMQLQPTWN